MLHTHGYNWWKLEDLSPASLDSAERQKVCNLVVNILYNKNKFIDNNKVRIYTINYIICDHGPGLDFIGKSEVIHIGSRRVSQPVLWAPSVK